MLENILFVLIYIVPNVRLNIKYGIKYSNSISFVLDKRCSSANIVDEIIRNKYLFLIVFFKLNLNIISSINGIMIHNNIPYIILLLRSKFLFPISLLDIPLGITI